jgi:site-specific DNA-methyltransferase (adenine-specific)
MTGIFHIVLARKPLEGTIAENCLQWGCGALWIDGTRVSTDDIIQQSGEVEDLDRSSIHVGYDRPNATMFRTGKPKERSGPAVPLGRFPANLILGGEEVVEGFPQLGVSRGGSRGDSRSLNFGMGRVDEPQGFGDSGSAARFFFNFSEQESDE